MRSEHPFTKPFFSPFRCAIDIDHFRHHSISLRTKIRSELSQMIRDGGDDGQLQLNLQQTFSFRTRKSTGQAHDQLLKLDQGKLEMRDSVTREAAHEEECWEAAKLRAECHWEHRENERFAESYIKKFAEQEFHELIKRSKGYNGVKCSCIVSVREDMHVDDGVRGKVVGTLDLSIRYFLQGETYPGERVQAQPFCSIGRSYARRYGYVANLCVARSSRREGIASTMLLFAAESTRSHGVQQLFAHVHRDNKAAQKLYQKLGFKIMIIAQHVYCLRIGRLGDTPCDLTKTMTSFQWKKEKVLFDRITPSSSNVIDFFRLADLARPLENFRSTLITVRSLLNDAEAKQLVDPSVKDRLYLRRDALYDAEDIADEPANNVSVIGICGMGGIGKTLAQLVYNDDRLRDLFDVMSWVCVSDTFDVVHVTRMIVECATRTTCNLDNFELLQAKLSDLLSNKSHYSCSKPELLSLLATT
ncbi:hypothetical protein Drorol1_Dr00005790 [Drosera rotundifolia]